MSEQQTLIRKYGHYCINFHRSAMIVEQNIKFFNTYMFNNGLKLRIDAVIIKPVQRLTR